MTIKHAMREKLKEMPPLAGMREVEAWLAGQPEVMAWVRCELTRRGALMIDDGTWHSVPPVVKVRAPMPQTLTMDSVVRVVREGETKCAGIVEVCMARRAVSRRTVMSRLNDAVAAGLLVRTLPAGSYVLPEEIKTEAAP